MKYNILELKVLWQLSLERKLKIKTKHLREKIGLFEINEYLLHPVAHEGQNGTKMIHEQGRL